MSFDVPQIPTSVLLVIRRATNEKKKDIAEKSWLKDWVYLDLDKKEKKN